jgi:hypothetical protein
MKRALNCLGLLFVVVMLDSCALLQVLQGLEVLAANQKISKTELSPENLEFQETTGINVTYVMQAMYSMTTNFPNTKIGEYYEALLAGKMVFHVDNLQKEFAHQTQADDIIHITINDEFKDYTEEHEMFVLLAAAASTFAIKDDPPRKKTPAQVFFKCLDGYDIKSGDYKNINTAMWYKNKQITIAGDTISL